jgi:hypothetical protein
MQPYRTLSHIHAFKTGHYSKLIEEDGKNSKIQAQPKNLGNNYPPSRNPNGPYKKQSMRQDKNCQRLSRPVTKQPA